MEGRGLCDRTESGPSVYPPRPPPDPTSRGRRHFGRSFGPFPGARSVSGSSPPRRLRTGCGRTLPGAWYRMSRTPISGRTDVRLGEEDGRGHDTGHPEPPGRRGPRPVSTSARRQDTGGRPRLLPSSAAAVLPGDGPRSKRSDPPTAAGVPTSHDRRPAPGRETRDRGTDGPWEWTHGSETDGTDGSPDRGREDGDGVVDIESQGSSTDRPILVPSRGGGAPKVAEKTEGARVSARDPPELSLVSRSRSDHRRRGYSRQARGSSRDFRDPGQGRDPQ